MSFIFDAQGTLIANQPDGNDIAVWNGMQVPFITGSQLLEYAATVYSESTPTAWLQALNPAVGVDRERVRETFGLVFTMYNYANAKGAAMKRAGRVYGLNELLKDSSYTKGITSPGHQEYYQQGGDPARRREATMSVIKLFTQQMADVQDVIAELNGACYWDGNDLFRNYPNHFRARNGFELGNPAHGGLYQNLRSIGSLASAQVLPTSSPASDPKVASARQFTYLSTMTAGGSIFFKIHPQAAAQGVTW